MASDIEETFFNFSNVLGRGETWNENIPANYWHRVQRCVKILCKLILHLAKPAFSRDGSAHQMVDGSYASEARHLRTRTPTQVPSI